MSCMDASHSLTHKLRIFVIEMLDIDRKAPLKDSTSWLSMVYFYFPPYSDFASRRTTP